MVGFDFEIMYRRLCFCFKSNVGESYPQGPSILLYYILQLVIDILSCAEYLQKVFKELARTRSPTLALSIMRSFICLIGNIHF